MVSIFVEKISKIDTTGEVIMRINACIKIALPVASIVSQNSIK
jgi:hypothetical protein